MAYTALPATSKMSRDAEVLLGTIASPLASGQAADIANGNSFSPKKANKVVVLVGMGAGAGTLTIKAGAYPPALASGEGDYVTASIASGAFAAITVDASRHLQADGTIDVQLSAAGTIWVLEASA